MALRLQGSAEDTFEVQDTDIIANGDPDVSYTIRRLSVPKLREIYERLRRKANVKRNGEVDALELSDEEVDYALVDWKGIVDAKGAPLACDRQNKLGDISQGLLGLPGDRRAALVRVAQQGAQQQEDAKQKSFREAESIR
jgi:hypothetical protein